MNWSPLQLDVYDKVQNTNSNILISATAGSGKTTTTLHCLTLIPKFKKTVFLSFSNTIVNELRERVPSHVKASTLHSLGCRMIMDYYKGIKVHENKFFNLALKSFKKSEFNNKIYYKCFQIQEIANFLRLTLTPFNLESALEMCEHYGLDGEEDFILKAIDLIENDYNPKQIDFTDMLYIPATNPKIINEVFDYVFIDECQDTNNCQFKFLQEIRKTSGRQVAVGDPHQTIYGFMGNSIDSFDQFKKIPNTIELPLSVSYRCGKNIVDEARKVNTEIFSFEGSKMGEVREGSVDEIKEGDMVISRTNAPLVSLFFYLIGKGVKAHIVGKDIEKGIVKLAESVLSSSRAQIISDLERKLEKIEDELEKLKVAKPQQHPRYRAMYEKVEIILLILSKVNKPSDLVKKIHEIFDDSKEGTKLMSMHKSKGVENERVFFIQSFNGEVLIPSKYARKDWEKLQEVNLQFVGITRAKSELVYLHFSDEGEEVEI